MEQLKSDFEFCHLEDYNYINFEKSLLWIINVKSIPPHIGISSQNKFFSLKHNGKDEGRDTNFLLSKMIKNGIPVVFSELKMKIELSKIKTCFSDYTRADQIQNSCLKPILDVLNLSGKHQKISDLLRFLSASNQITNFYSLNIPTDKVSIPYYSIEKISETLRKLSHVER